MVACAKMGLNFTACAPKELFPDEELVAKARAIAEENECTVTLTEDVEAGTRNADVIYTDIWVSMGEPDEVWETRIKLLQKYQVNRQVMENAKKSAIFMHCLPSFHDTNTCLLYTSISGALYGLLSSGGDCQKAVTFGNATAAVKNTIPGDLPSSNLEEIETIIKAHNQTGPQSEMAR